MPAYDQPIRFNLHDATRSQDKKIAAVIQFNSTDMERVQEFLRKLEERGIASATHARSYDPQHTSPELYFP